MLNTTNILKIFGVAFMGFTLSVRWAPFSRRLIFLCISVYCHKTVTTPASLNHNYSVTYLILYSSLIQFYCTQTIVSFNTYSIFLHHFNDIPIACVSTTNTAELIITIIAFTTVINTAYSQLLIPHLHHAIHGH